MRQKGLVTIVLLMMCLGTWASDTITVAKRSDTITVGKPAKEMSWLRRTIRGFSYIDENYVEPQHYNWSVMLQATYTYDFYRLSTIGSQRQSVTFAPDGRLKFGPYFGWRWVFLGYAFDLRKVDIGSSSSKQEIDLSFYAAQVGADLYYRKTGSDYKIRDVQLGVDGRQLEDVPFDGISVGITGVNVYYIFNHKRFSYPAAFAQSTCQKISCGSWMAGLGYTRNSIDFDHEKLEKIASERMAPQQVKLDSGLMFRSVEYSDISASVGYAYNWVFAKDFLFCASLSMALAYKQTRGETTDNDKRGFNFNNFNLDGIGRFGLVWNNTRWYAGASAIVRAYNYRKSRFAANNIFGNLNFYVGYNFGLRAHYKNKK